MQVPGVLLGGIRVGTELDRDSVKAIFGGRAHPARVALAARCCPKTTECESRTPELFDMAISGESLNS